MPAEAPSLRVGWKPPTPYPAQGASLPPGCFLKALRLESRDVSAPSVLQLGPVLGNVLWFA